MRRVLRSASCCWGWWIWCGLKLFKRWSARRKRRKEVQAGEPAREERRKRKGKGIEIKKRCLCTDQNDPWRTGNRTTGHWLVPWWVHEKRARWHREELLPDACCWWLWWRFGWGQEHRHKLIDNRCEWLKQGLAPSASGGSEGANVWCDGNWGPFPERHCDLHLPVRILQARRRGACKALAEQPGGAHGLESDGCAPFAVVTICSNIIVAVAGAFAPVYALSQFELLVLRNAPVRKLLCWHLRLSLHQQAWLEAPNLAKEPILPAARWSLWPGSCEALFVQSSIPPKIVGSLAPPISSLALRNGDIKPNKMRIRHRNND